MAEILKAVTLHLCKNILFLCFCVLPDSAEALFRQGRKLNKLLIAQSISKVCAKNYKNQILHCLLKLQLKMSGIFFEKSVGPYFVSNLAQ